MGILKLVQRNDFTEKHLFHQKFFFNAPDLIKSPIDISLKS